MSRTLFTLMLFLAFATQLEAQTVVVRGGDVVRVQSTSAVGRFTVDRIGSGRILLRDTAGSIVDVPLDEVSDLRVLRGPRSAGAGALRGAGYGLLVGGGAGVAIGLMSGDDPPDQWFAFTAEEKAAMMGVLLGAGGAVIGALIGVSAPGERWERVSPGETTRVLPSGDGGITVGYTVRF